MKTKDLLIVSQLRSNARAPVLVISRAVRMCRSVVAERVRILQKGIITKYTALIDFGALGYSHRMLLLVKLIAEDRSVFCRFMQQQEMVNNMYALHETDFAVELIFQTHEEGKCFLDALQQAFVFEVYHVFSVREDIIREAFLKKSHRCY